MLFPRYPSAFGFTVAPEKSGWLLICSDRGFDVHQYSQANRQDFVIFCLKKLSRGRDVANIFFFEKEVNKIRYASNKAFLHPYFITY